jgi:hypothetical protein
MFGVVPALVDQAGKEIKGEGEGLLVIKQAWPGQVCDLDSVNLCFRGDVLIVGSCAIGCCAHVLRCDVH